MPLDSLIPIGGATGGSSGSKRSGASDLTSGLISISGTRDNVDVDMSYFDVGDLLGDDSGKSKSKSKDRSDERKKKKSKDKPKTSSSSNKKSKSKSKKSAFDDDDDFGNGSDGAAADDWNSSAKNWESAAELEMAAAAAARRKNGRGKIGGLDDEFAKMLGLEGEDISTGAESNSSPEPADRIDPVDTDDTYGISGYTEQRGEAKTVKPTADTTRLEGDEFTKGRDGGISASFFQDDGKDDHITSLSSFLGSTTERRGGFRGGRRQVGGGESDPFGFGSTTTTSSSTFDALFGGTSSRRSPLDDPFGKPAKTSLEEDDSKQHSHKDHIEEHKTDQAKDFLSQEVRPAQRLSAKDDLLADLFSSQPRSGARGNRSDQQPTFSSNENEIDGHNEKPSKVESTRPMPTVTDPAKQQNDLLAELLAAPSSSEHVVMDTSKDEAGQVLEHAIVEAKASTPPKARTPPQENTKSHVESAVTSESITSDLASARDSLLLDLLSDLSPPKPNEPLLSRRRSRSNNNSNSSSPDKEIVKAEDPFKSSLPPSPVQSQPLPTVPETPANQPSGSITAAARPVTPPSPGRRRSLTLDKGALAIRESDFEQSKDSLLEEILPSSPSASARSSPHRRNSYSQSFEVEDIIAADADAEQVDGIVEVKQPQVSLTEPPEPELPASVALIIESPPPAAPQLKPEKEVLSTKLEPTRLQPSKHKHDHKAEAVFAPICNCVEREAKLTAAFEIDRAALQQQIDELTRQLEVQAAANEQAIQQLIQQLGEHETTAKQLSQQLDARVAANTQLAQQLASTERDKYQADQLAATCKDDAASFQHRADQLESELRSVREELSRSKRAVQDAELALARKTAEQDEAAQLERHREKRALEALSAQMQRALARLTISHQVHEEGSGFDNSAARVAAEDEARLRVIASLEGSSKRAAQHAEEERTKLAELLRELEAGARNARQGALEDKERLRQEQQRLDALSAHLQAQSAVLRDQEAAHAAYMGQQLAEAREDARVYEARLATRRTQLERDERALYEARADFAAFREQTALEIEREYEQLRVSRLALEDAWRELRADQEDLEAELASHEDEFQELESRRQEVEQAEARLAERTQEVVALAEKLDIGTRDLLEREQLVAQQAAVVQDTDTSFANRERALERVKTDLEAREYRLHAQIRQLDGARVRLTQQRREQQQLMAAARRHYTTETPVKPVVDNNKLWRRSEVMPVDRHSSNNESYDITSSAKDKLNTPSWEMGVHVEEDPSGLSSALRKQVEDNWQRRNQTLSQRRQTPSRKFVHDDFSASFASQLDWPTKTKKSEAQNGTSKARSGTTFVKASTMSPTRKLAPYSCDNLASVTTPTSTISFHTPSAAVQRLHSSHQQPPPPRPLRSNGTFQPTLRVNL